MTQRLLQPGATQVGRDSRAVGGGRCSLPKQRGALPANRVWTVAVSDGEHVNPTGKGPGALRPTGLPDQPSLSVRVGGW